MGTPSDPPVLADVIAAASRIAPFAHRTPVLRSRGLDEWLGVRAALKCEHLQRVGAFKYRGATNAVQLLSDADAARGVCAHSSGNHAAALALAARDRGIAAHLVMPENVSAVKLAAVRGYGAQVTLCAPTLVAREATVAEVRERTGAIEIHPYDDPRIIAGAGTAALELLDECGDLDAVVTPIGGGGLLAGTCVAVHARTPGIRIVAGEPSGADDAAQSLATGTLVPQTDPRTIADGLLTSMSARTFGIIREHVEQIVTVDDDEIVAAMRVVWQRTKQIIEPSAAVAVAAVRSAVFAPGTNVGIVLSGGNVDLDALPW
ncbi:MAG TPA: pyridoxal-phosphate dependent enzyme [Acidimicrobiia bacterium]|nr:pyridoxal-phosphate dependent enzyme [Acidimicrobiia bacterium]